ncbi:MAG: hypothetical protein HY651_07865 [Acidobacteria bacterium]|nr:hypothetical protein [Acidobacteriota bacterium]
MSFWEAVALVGTMATILGVFITIYGLINNRVLKAEAAGIREILLRVESGQKEARQEMAEAIRHLGDLIKLDGEKTRETVRAKA